VRLHRLELWHVAGVDHQVVELADVGITLVQGANEVGKSTLLRALDALLEQPDSANKQAIRDLQPVGQDVGPEVEAELTIGSQRLCYRKRWLRGQRTELRRIDPPGNPATGRQAHDTVRRLLDEQVDVALWRALRLQQGLSLDSPTLAQSASLSQALDAIGADRASTADTTLVELAAAERARYFTPKRGDPTGDLKAAMEAEQQASAAAEVAADAVAAAETAIAQVTRLRRELQELERERDRRQQQAEQAGRAWAEVERQRQELQEQQERSRAAESDRARAQQAMDHRRELIAEADRRSQERRQATEAWEQVRIELDQAASAAERARDRRQSAEDAVQQAKQHHERLRLVRQWAEAKADAATLADRLRRARAQDDVARHLQRQLDGLAIGDDQVEEIRKLDEDRRLAAAKLEVGAPQVEVQALTDLDLALDGSAQHLPAGGTVRRSAQRTTIVEVPGLVRVQVQPGTSVDDLTRQVDATARALAEACRWADVTDLADAEARSSARAKLARDHADAVAERDRIAGEDGVDGLAARLGQAEALADRLGSRLDGRDDPQLVALVDQPEALAAELATAEQAAGAAEAALADADAEDQRAAADRHRAELAAAQAHGAAQAAADEADQAVRRLADARQERSDQRLADELAWAEQAAARATATEAALRRALDALDPESVDRRAQVAEQALADTRAAWTATHEEVLRLDGQVRQAGADGLYTNAAAAADVVRQARHRLDVLRRRAAAADLLAATLDRHRQRAHAHYGPALADAVGRLASGVFGEPATVTLDEQLAIAEVRRRGQRLRFDQLSAGTREQLAVLLRVAAAHLVARAGTDDSVPIVLDDAFGFTDPDRLLHLIATLRSSATATQILILTCHPERYRGITPAAVVSVGTDGAPAGPHTPTDPTRPT